MRDKHDRRWQICSRVHSFLALSLGLFFAVLGLAGSLSVYGGRLDTLLNPELLIKEPGNRYQSLDRIMMAVQTAHPDRRGSWTLELPQSSKSMLTAWYDNPRESAIEFYAPLMVSVNPYTAKIVASRFWGQTAATWLSDLHTQFHFGRSGWNAVGWLGLALMVSSVTGLYLGWPGLRRLPQSFGICHDSGTHQLALDLHRAVGFFSAIFLLILAFTGANLAFPKVSETLVGTSGMSHGDEGPAIRSSAIPNDRPVGLDEAVLLARGPFPHAEVRQVATPDGPSGTYRISLRQRFEANQRHPATTVWVDQYSGQIREVRNPSRFTRGETALTWLWPLHTGEIWGPWGRFLWFLIGLSPAMLYVTGILRWLVRRGLVPDRPADLPRFRPHIERLASQVVNLGAEKCRNLLPFVSGLVSRTIRRLEAEGRSIRERWRKQTGESPADLRRRRE